MSKKKKPRKKKGPGPGDQKKQVHNDGPQNSDFFHNGNGKPNKPNNKGSIRRDDRGRAPVHRNDRRGG